MQIGENPGLEELAEGLAELLAHDAVEDEVDGAVDQGQDVHEVAEGGVARLEEVLAPDGAQQAEHALRQLRDDEEGEHGDQDVGGAVDAAVLALLAAVLAAATAAAVHVEQRVLVLVRGVGVALEPELVAAHVGHAQGADEPAGDDGEDDAGHQLDDDEVRPEVQIEEQLVVAEREAAEVQHVDLLLLLAHHHPLLVHAEHQVRRQAEDERQDVRHQYAPVALLVRVHVHVPLRVSETIEPSNINQPIGIPA